MSTPAEIPARHHAIIAEEVGGPEVLRWTETAVPTPGAGEVLVRTAAAGLNFIETYQRSGVYAVPHPFTPGSEGSGVVVALGPGVDEALRGARVATAAGRGTYAEHFTAPAEQLLHVPAGVDLADAAALPLQGMTAHYLCRSTFPVQPGHVVALTAGAGGVGLLLTQLAAARGATVITAASTEDKRALSAAAGPPRLCPTPSCGRPSWTPPAVRAPTRCSTAPVRTPSRTRWPPCACGARWCSSAAPPARCPRSTSSG